MRTIRIGLAGCGFAGHIHSRALILAKGSRISSKVKCELVAVADINESRALATAKQYGWKHVEKNWSDLFTYDLDLLVVALPNDEHVDIVKRAVRENVHVLLEKPVARTYDQAMELMNIAKSNNRIRTGYVNRFVPAVQQAKMLIQRGEIGEIRMVRSVYLLNMRRPGGTADWRFNAKSAGYGASDDLGSHHIDLINFLAGDITGVQAATRIWNIPDTPAATNDDAINSLIFLQNGAFGTLTASRTSPGHPLTGYVEVEGSRGALRIDRAFLNDLFVRHESGAVEQRNVRPAAEFATLWASPTVQGAHPFSWYDCFAFQMAEMIQIAADTPLEFEWSATLADGVKAMGITEAMIKSAQTSLPVKTGVSNN